MIKKITIFVFLIIAVGVVYWKYFLPQNTSETIPDSELYQGISYTPVNQKDFEVSLFSKFVKSPTRLKITPDDKHLLVTSITGEVYDFPRSGDNFSQQPVVITK